MPGIHFVHGHQARNGAPTFKAMLSELLHDEQYRAEVLYSDELVSLGTTRYPEYPIAVWDDADYFIVLEGKLYGLNDRQLHADLRSLGSLLFQDAFDAVKDWLLAHDGEYLVLVRDKRTSQWSLVNDALGRLPVYYSRVDGLEVISREIRFVAESLRTVRMDRMALAQYLLLGCPLGRRTTLEEVDCLAPATMLRFGLPGGGTDRTVLYRLNLEQKDHALPLGDYADQLVSQFIQACRDRTEDDGRAVVSLSGGLDSRCVAVGLKKAGLSFRTVTFDDALGGASSDVAVARELTERLGFDWELIHLTNPTGRELEHFLRMRGGMNHLAQAFGQQFLDEIARRYGRDIIFLSGDGGDGALPDIVPPREFGSLDEVVRHFIVRYQLFPTGLVEELTRVSIDEIIDDLTPMVAAFPEQRLEYKYVHLLWNGRRQRWLYEGEESNRATFWCCAPFYGLPFFMTAFRCPDEYKRTHLLYREFLKRLSPEAAQVADANRGLAVTSAAYERKLRLIGSLNRHPRIAAVLRKIWRPHSSYNSQSTIVSCMQDQIKHSPVVSEYIDPVAFKRLLDHCHKYTREAMDNLLTVTAATEMLTGAECTLDRYLDDEF